MKIAFETVFTTTTTLYSQYFFYLRAGQSKSNDGSKILEFVRKGPAVDESISMIVNTEYC